MIKFFFKKQKTIEGAAVMLGFFTILAQILAIFKNKLLAVHYGSSIDLDIFYTAFKIPDTIFLLIGTMAVGSILIPIFTDKENISIWEKEKFMTRFLNSFSLLLILISGIIYFFIPTILDKLFPLYQGSERELLVFMSRLFLLSPILMGIANFFISVNQRNKIFLPMALTGVFYNLALIFGILFLSPVWGIKGLAYSVILGAFLFLAIQLPTIFKYHLIKYRLKFLKWEEVKNMFKITLPRSVALSVSSVVVLYFYSKISDLEVEGLIVVFTFAYTIFWLPISLINSSYSSAMLPVISKFYSQKKIDQFNNTIREVISRIFFLIIPMSFFVFGFSKIIIGAFFSSQKFGIVEIDSSAILLSLLAIMIPFQVLLLTISKIFYSMGETKPVMWVNLFAGFLILIFIKISSYFNLNLESYNFVNDFGNLLKFILIFILSYISASILIIWKLKRKIKNINIFNFNSLLLKILISFISLILTYLIFIFSDLGVQINFIHNLSLFVGFGLTFVLFIIFFSEFFKEDNYLEFKKKIISKILK